MHQFELLRSIAGRHAITLLTSDWNIEAEPLRTVRGLGVRVQTVAWPWHIRPRTKLSKLIRLLRGAAPTMEVFMNHARLGPLSEAVAAEERSRPADLVFIMMGELAPVVAAAKAPTALLLFDVYSRLTDLVRDERSLRSVRHRLERRNAIRWEPAWYRRAGAVACVSDVDAELVSAMVGRRVEVIPNPIPDDFFDPPQVERSASTITFVGSFSWEPNRDSVAWLCEDIWPMIRAGLPDARLCIVGRHGSEELQRQVEQAGGEFHTDVEDIRPYYWDAAVVIAPVRMGSGTRNKVLHAMACDAPVVSTTSALEGIPATPGTHLLVADDSQGLADAVLKTLNEPAAAAARVLASREIAARYSAAGAGATFEAWLEAAAGSSSRTTCTPAATRRAPLTASIVLATEGRSPYLRRCLESVRDAVGNAPGTEVIIVEQGEPAAEAICRDLALDATVVPGSGSDHSKARNIGMRRAAGDVVLLTDDDCEVPLDWVQGHLDALADPENSVSFGEVTGNGSPNRYEPTALPSRHRRASSPPWLMGSSANMAALRETLNLVGGFDERLGSGAATRSAGADADLIVRLLRSGSVIASGTGTPVRRAGAGTGAEPNAAILADERGAGVWIGKALREEPRAAVALLRSRLDVHRHIANGRTTTVTRVGRGPLAGALTRGVVAGLRLKPWRAGTGGTGNPSEDRGR